MISPNNRRNINVDFRLSDLNPDAPIHLAGIAGAAMCGLAHLLSTSGLKVTGTDPRADEVRDLLAQDNIEVHAIQDGRHIPSNASLVIATAALPKDHPELVAAADQGIRIISYAAFLGVLMRDRYGIAIAGTHGKTTTASMVAFCLKQAGVQPGFLIGGFSPDLGTSADNGAAPVFVAEACEYNRSFLHLTPKVAVITNIEEDHLDVYADLKDIEQTFAQFASAVGPEGHLVYNADCPNTRSAIADLHCKKTPFSIEGDAAIGARNIRSSPAGMGFDLTESGRSVQQIQMNQPGVHNVSNALAAAATCRLLGLSTSQIAKGFKEYQGATRRFEVRGEAAGVCFVDDYAHHPTEIRAMLRGAREKFGDRRFVAVFQPHQCSRTRHLLAGFATAFSEADVVLIADIYSVRDSTEDRLQVHASELTRRIQETGKPAQYTGSLGETAAYLKTALRPGDVLFTIGAGDVDWIIGHFLPASVSGQSQNSHSREGGNL
ncbi:MAG: UDP-N-acetylmuramate--L-alanine ligase [Myxococcota bacterium]|nr:UDP-N-acetylmuramate--L-alanine ligase [Myxococcota bacterium]